MKTNHCRRKLLRVGGAALAMIPLATITRQARGTTNSEKRSELKYQVTPLNGNSCVSCLEFIPGKTEHDFGGCKQIPGDDEISPTGYCVLWNTM